MMKQTYNDKNIIWESKLKQILLIAVGFLFVAAIIWTKDKTSGFIYWSTIIFFGGCALLFLIRLLNPKNLFVKHNTKLGKEILADQFRKEQESLGFFTYTDDGFSLRNYKEITICKWSEIQSVLGFKEDRNTTDEICMDIFASNNLNIQLTESTPGWFQFQKRLRENIPTIPSNWEGGISVPAFETKLTLLFDRNGKTLEEVMAACYTE